MMPRGKLGLGSELTNPRQQGFDRFRLRGMGKSRKQFFRQLDRVGKLVAADQLLNSHLELLTLFDLGVLLKRV